MFDGRGFRPEGHAGRGRHVCGCMGREAAVRGRLGWRVNGTVRRAGDNGMPFAEAKNFWEGDRFGYGAFHSVGAVSSEKRGVGGLGV